MTTRSYSGEKLFERPSYAW